MIITLSKKRIQIFKLVYVHEEERGNYYDVCRLPAVNKNTSYITYLQKAVSASL